MNTKYQPGGSHGGPSPYARTTLIKRPREACVNCRALKTRCLPCPDKALTSKDPCARCTKYSLSCDYVRRPRGKPKDEQVTPEHGAKSESRASFTHSHSQGSPSRDHAEYQTGPTSTVPMGVPDDRRHEYMAYQSNEGMMSSERASYERSAWGVGNQSQPSGYSTSFSRNIQQPTSHPYPQPEPSFPSYQPPPYPPESSIQSQHSYPQHEALPTQLPPMLPPASTSGRRSMGTMDLPDMMSNTHYRSGAYPPPPPPPVQLPPIDSNISQRRPATAPGVTRKSQSSSTPSWTSSDRRRRAGQMSTNILDYSEPRLDSDEGSRSPSPRPLDNPRLTGATGPLLPSLHPSDSARLTSASKSSKAGTSQSSLSPLELGMVSESEAQSLYTNFAQNLCPVLAGIDIVYITYDRARSSDTLFTAILYASARFYHPEICRPLYNHANVLLNRMIMAGAVDKPSIQALMILAYWGLPNDKSGYMKSGVAVRAAAHLKLWKREERPLPENEEEAREVLDGERTWIALLIMDAGFARVFGQPMMLPPPGFGFDEAFEWAAEHEYLNIPGDFYLAWSVANTHTSSQLPATIPHTDEVPSGTLGSSLALAETTLVNDLSRLAHRLSPMYRQMADIVTTIVCLHMRAMAIEFEGPTEAVKGRIVETTEKLAKALTQFSDEGLVFWSDMISVGVTMPGALFYQARLAYSPAEWDRILPALNSIMQMCSNMLGAHNDHPLYFTYRFYRRLLPVLERLRNGLEVQLQNMPAVEMEYPYPAVFGMPESYQDVGMFTDAMMGNNDVAGTGDPLWDFILGPDSGMSQLFPQMG
ncbi:hypothetical protein L202_03337 [Cryptococcus amylolentus CBS 6039]|uniref:Zn(2)-C6 fungal-type domain-containing protein n=1 Tax=Cryptococcus amylolentus CBS 6039 TaxID=1295533 RepID=A0A1E3HSJ8_9TREE|nr:hypothetical protein L202_03337 [Cryptococcus amylolentus CBS 6039]ODN79330.1 hypothetical protein L202_03337 [Cryptococcus amylolentus CBS 6039]